MFVKAALFAVLSLLAPVSGSYYNTPDLCTDNLVDILNDKSRFSTLAAAIRVAGLEASLSSMGPYTIFAPTNNAFIESLGRDGIDTILDDPAALRSVLRYHVVPRNLEESDLTEVSYTTLQQSDIEFTFVNSDVVVNDLAEITTFDICGSNGIIHAIDRVLVPPNVVIGFTPPVQCTGKGKGKGYNGSGNDCSANMPFCTGKGKGKGYTGSDCVAVSPPAIPQCDGKGKGKGYSGLGTDCISGPRPCAGKGKGKGFANSGDCFEVPPFCSGKGKGKGYGSSSGGCTPVPPYCTGGKGKGKGYNGLGNDCTPLPPPPAPVYTPVYSPVFSPVVSPTRVPTRAPVPTCNPEGTDCDNANGDFCCSGLFCEDYVCSPPCVSGLDACSVSGQNCCGSRECVDTDGGNPNLGTCVLPCLYEDDACSVIEQDCCSGLECVDTDGGNPNLGTCVEPCKAMGTSCMMGNPNCCDGTVCLASGGSGMTGTCEDPPTRAPVDPPTRAPVDPPTRAPVDPPTRAPVDPPTRAPVPDPTRAPVPPPTPMPVPDPTRAPVPPPTRAPVPDPTRAPVPAPTRAPVPAPTPMPVNPSPVPCQRNIYYLANNNDTFDYFARALRRTGLDLLLKDTQATFTVFAPTDSAFLHTFGTVAGVLEVLQGDLGTLRDTILYHVLENKSLYSDDFQQKHYGTALGETMEIFFVNHDIVLNDEAEIIYPFDICANNGVIHAIDRVLTTPGSEKTDDYSNRE